MSAEPEPAGAGAAPEPEPAPNSAAIAEPARPDETGSPPDPKERDQEAGTAPSAPAAGHGTGDLSAAEPSAFAEPAPAEVPQAPPEPRPEHPPVPTPPVQDVHDLDWSAVRAAVDPSAVRGRMRAIVEGMEALLDRPGGPNLLFDQDRGAPGDRAIQVKPETAAGPLWIIGDLHGDLLALEAALAMIRREGSNEEGSRIVFLGDLFDDGGFGLELLLRVFELIVEAPDRICVIAGNHDEALSYDGVRFGASVSPSDFADLLNANLAHEWIERAGKLAVRFFARAPRALFFPDGLLIAHGGFPLADLHSRLAETGDWNDPACLADFVWTRAHPTARRKLPNRFSRGSQFGREDFAAFCALAGRLGRPVTHLVRGHDHVEERWAVYPAYEPTPVLTTVALSRRLPRESFGPPTRAPTLARRIERSLPQVYRLHLPPDLILAAYPELTRQGEPAHEASS